MEFVIFINGKVSHPLTIDPSVWIFDERKVDLNTYFDLPRDEEDELTKYTKAISKQWDKEITEGSEPPKPTNGNVIKYKRQELENGTFGMHLLPFIKNAQPEEGVSEMIVETHDGKKEIFSLEMAKQFILQFSHIGKPLREDGPIYILFGDGSNRTNPIKNVKQFTIK
ncbi:peptidyl-prolyl cis-trans isomerase [Alkalihalobacterium elongatum]|uniref:peptidyl-prolyl cis-trans isomerase n=1 Tax=Alkalihalobacterium elongatum TaxID=2675466 RepID=UPI001C1FA807|nr:peptidyl-prolyl cis-trans isomerase [Alkalihalobacterium elongatum]